MKPILDMTAGSRMFWWDKHNPLAGIHERGGEMTEFTGGINIPKDDIDFGDYVLIEQKRYGVPNEMFQFKVVGSYQSNTYRDVPMDAVDRDKKLHPHVVDVLNVICCGIDETKVDTVRKADVRLIKSRNDEAEK